MLPVRQLLDEALLWVPALLMIVVSNALVAFYGRPLGNWRWLVASFVLSSPLLLPKQGSYALFEMGMLNTIVTSLAIVSAARLPDWDHAARRAHVTRRTLFAWLSLPTVSLNSSCVARDQRFIVGIRHLLKALVKRLSWEALAFIFAQLDALPWLLKSALLMLYFVLNLTAFHDLVVGLCHMSGLGVDELFDRPLLSRSPRDFWSRRWNKFISRFALKHVALKVRHRVPPFGVLVLVFGCSGLFHEYFAWGVGGLSRAPGAMSLFFSIQALAVWVGILRPWPVSTWITQPLTFLWMAVTAPLFFLEVSPAILAFGYPKEWLPFSHEVFLGGAALFPN